MCNSPVVRAEPLKFKEEGVKGVIKDVFLPWYNVYRFLIQEVTRYESAGKKFVPNPALIKTSTNFLDKWINAGNHGLIKFVKEELEAYRLYTVVGRLVNFLEDLTNWYVRLNRDRMRGNNGPEDALLSLCTLYDVLLNTCVLLAPLTPFITEMLYQNLARALPDGHAMKCKSVHWVMIPDYDPEALNPEVLLAVERLQSVVELGRTCRERKKVGQRTPLKGMQVLNKSEAFMNDIKALEAYLKEELNVMAVTLSTDTSSVVLAPTLNFKSLGKKLGKDMKSVQEAVNNLTQEELQAFDAKGVITVSGYELARNDDEPELSELTVTPKVAGLADPNLEPNGNAESVVIMDFTPDEDLEMMATSRAISNTVQKLRKEAKLQQSDPVDMWASVIPSKKTKGYLSKVLTGKKEYIDSLLRRPLLDGKLLQGHEVLVITDETEIGEDKDKLVVTITASTPFFKSDAINKLVGGDSKVEFAVKQYLATYDLKKLMEATAKPVKVVYEGKSFELKYKEHWVLSPSEAPWL
jgi:isoleucyl-tRNA synthetase